MIIITIIVIIIIISISSITTMPLFRKEETRQASIRKHIVLIIRQYVILRFLNCKSKLLSKLQT